MTVLQAAASIYTVWHSTAGGGENTCAARRTAEQGSSARIVECSSDSQNVPCQCSTMQVQTSSR